MSARAVILREMRDVDGSRLLTAMLTPAGDLVIEGTDRGSGVERVFGACEYEWIWTISASSIPDLLQALQGSSDILHALYNRFRDERASSAHSWRSMPFRFHDRRGLATD